MFRKLNLFFPLKPICAQAVDRMSRISESSFIGVALEYLFWIPDFL